MTDMFAPRLRNRSIPAVSPIEGGRASLPPEERDERRSRPTLDETAARAEFDGLGRSVVRLGRIADFVRTRSTVFHLREYAFSKAS